MAYLTQLDVAKRVGVSREAVAFAISSNPRLNRKLRPETRRQILKTVHQLGYVPHHAARRLARSQSDSRATSFDQVGLIYFASRDEPDAFVDPVCLAMMQGAEHELSECDASLTFVRVRESKDWKKVERLTRAGGVDAWLLYGTVNDEVVSRLKTGKLPYLIAGDHRCTQPVHCVTVDYKALGRLAVQHFASLGHRRIAFFIGGTWFVYQEQTLAGFRAALKEFGLDEDERLIGEISAWHDPAAGHIVQWERAVQWLKNADPMPTAVFSPELNWAAELCRALKQSGLEVPNDVSLLACESVFHEGSTQNFSRIGLPMTEVGRQGALLLYKLVLQPDMKPNDVMIAPSLSEGWSTGPARSAKAD